MNAQTKIMLVSAHHSSDTCYVNNILCMVAGKMLPVTISDVMYAYMIAKDWVRWCKDPNSSDENPLKGWSAEDAAPHLDLFQRQADDLARELMLYVGDVRMVFEKLNPALINNWRSRDDLVRETTRMYHRSLRFTANLFAEQGDESFNKILKEKQVPLIS